MTSSVVGLGRNPKALPKARLATKNIHGHCAHPTHYNFLKPSETITSEKCAQPINEMHQKPQHLQPALIKRKGPVLLHDNV